MSRLAQLLPELAVEAAVLDGFGHVLDADGLDAGQVGDGARHLETRSYPRALSPSRAIAASSSRRPPAST
jgi:hypothetical protein